MHTGSAWIGYNFTFGKKLEFTVTPMVGGVFGEVNGGKKSYYCWKLLSEELDIEPGTTVLDVIFPIRETNQAVTHYGDLTDPDTG